MDPVEEFLAKDVFCFSKCSVLLDKATIQFDLLCVKSLKEPFVFSLLTRNLFFYVVAVSAA